MNRILKKVKLMFSAPKLQIGTKITQKIVYTSETNKKYQQMFDSQHKQNQYVNQMFLTSTFSRIIGNNFPQSIYLNQSVSVLKDVEIGQECEGKVEIVKDLGKNRYTLRTWIERQNETVVDGQAIILQQ